VIEVELKAHVRDRAAVEAAVAAYARPLGLVDKRDAYWHGPDWRLNRGTRGFRVRSECPAGSGAGGAASTIVTFKTKRSEGGIEINREREFEVSDPEAFVEFAQRLGCEPFFEKRKRGFAFKSGGLGFCEATIEIVEVEGLGDFIEIEVLLEEEEPSMVALAQGEIRALLARAGVGEEDIESRFYSELLIAAGLVAQP
jgi:predicted adenylyl cyclase CyaB